MKNSPLGLLIKENCLIDLKGSEMSDVRSKKQDFRCKMDDVKFKV